MQYVLDTLPTMAFAAAVVALLRKWFPRIDGWLVPVVYAALVVATSVLSHYSAAIPAVVWSALQVAATIVTGTGGVTLAQQVARKGQNFEWPVEPPTVPEKPNVT